MRTTHDHPYVGMRVLYTDDSGDYPEFVGEVGTITHLDPDGGHHCVRISFDKGSVGWTRWFVCRRLSPFSPHDQAKAKDLAQRQAHADKYL